MRADGDVGCGGLRDDPLGLLNPAFDLSRSRKRFCRKVVFHQQASVVLISRVNPRAVNVRQGDRLQVHPGRLRHKGLYGRVIPMIILHGGGGFHLDHFPFGLTAFRCRQHHIGKGQSSARPETRFEDRPPGPSQQLCRTGKGCIKALRVHVNDGSCPLRIVEAFRNVPHLVARLKPRLSICRIFT